jgi:hypothetical protein
MKLDRIIMVIVLTISFLGVSIVVDAASSAEGPLKASAQKMKTEYKKMFRITKGGGVKYYYSSVDVSPKGPCDGFIQASGPTLNGCDVDVATEICSSGVAHCGECIEQTTCDAATGDRGSEVVSSSGCKCAGDTGGGGTDTPPETEDVWGD